MLLIVFFLLPIAIGNKSSYAYADEEETSAEETISNVIDGIELEGYEEYVEKLNEQYDVSIPDRIKQIVEDILYQRSELNAEYLLKMVIEFFVGNIHSFAMQACVILIVCILLSLLKNMSSGFASHSTEKIVYLACYGVIVTIVLSISSTIIIETTSSIDMLTLFTELVFPPLLTIMTAIGSVSAVGLYHPTLLFFSATLVTIIKKIVLPLFYLCFVLTIVGHFNEEIKLKKTVKTARSIAEWTLSIFFGIFSMITTAKGIAGSEMDSFTIRSAKYALSGYVPIVGNYLKEGFDIVVASCIVVKNAIGVTAIILLLITILSPILKITLAIFTLRITASIAEPFGEIKISNMLYGVSDCLKLFIILILCVAFSLFIILLLIILSFNGGVA